METTDGHSQSPAELPDTLCSDQAVEFAVLFGSHVTNETHASSDLDIAIKFTEDLSSQDRFHKLCFLSGDLQRTDPLTVDVSDIEALPIDVAHDALSGELLCGDERAFEETKANVEARFEDQRDEIRRRQRELIERIAEDGLHG